MSEFKRQQKSVIDWARDKGILADSTPFDQMGKMEEEVSELYDEVVRGMMGDYVDKEHISDELGDVLVTVIVQAYMQGLRLEDCLQKSLDKIQKRTGKMSDGVFVKDTEQAIRELSELTGEE